MCDLLVPNAEINNAHIPIAQSFIIPWYILPIWGKGGVHKMKYFYSHPMQASRFIATASVNSSFIDY